jgi:hypothetical protein
MSGRLDLVALGEALVQLNATSPGRFATCTGSRSTPPEAS